jgi:hypothetical protein
MSALAALLTPFDRGNAIELGNHKWRKRILPVGDVEYQGRTLHFTPSYLAGLAEAFKRRAYDQVSFQLADAANTHTNDPERHRGTIIDMEAETDGLWITLDPTPRGEQVLRENPYLGVSARIVEQYARSDGQFFPAAVQHVLGTLDPRIPGLGTWQSIEAANQPALVIDLTSASYAGQEGVPMPDLNAQQQANLNMLLNMDPAALAQLVGGQPPAQQQQQQQQAPPAAPQASADDVGELSDQELADLIDALDDEELEGLAGEFEDETLAGATATGLTAEAQMAIDLANARADETERQLGVFQARFEQQQFESEKRQLADVGVPPYITELARPLLQGTGHLVELANGQRADAGQVMRKVLTEYAKMAQLLDLGAELGTPMDEPPGGGPSAAETQRADLIGRAKQQMGLM